MLFREKLHYKPIKNRPGPNPGKYPYLHRLHYYHIQNKKTGARGKGPRNLKTYQ